MDFMTVDEWRKHMASCRKADCFCAVERENERLARQERILTAIAVAGSVLAAAVTMALVWQ